MIYHCRPFINPIFSTQSIDTTAHGVKVGDPILGHSNHRLLQGISDMNVLPFANQFPIEGIIIIIHVIYMAVSVRVCVSWSTDRSDDECTLVRLHIWNVQSPSIVYKHLQKLNYQFCREMLYWGKNLLAFIMSASTSVSVVENRILSVFCCLSVFAPVTWMASMVHITLVLIQWISSLSSWSNCDIMKTNFSCSWNLLFRSYSGTV